MDKTKDLIEKCSSLWTIEYKKKVIDLLKNWCRDKKKERIEYYCYEKYKIKVLDNVEDIVLKKDEKLMATKENALSIIENYHIKYGHKGSRITHKKIKENYANINRIIVDTYIRQCEICTDKLNKKVKIKKESEQNNVCAITSKDFNERVQIDLVDYQSKPDGPYKYIFHYTDDLTKYHILRPLKSKCAIEIANILIQIFTDFGPPQIIHSDINGREFTMSITQEISNVWPGIMFVYDQSQAVERNNRILKNTLTAWMKENNNDHWSEGLYYTQWSMNTTYSAEIKMSPYMAVFGVNPKLALPKKIVPKVEI